MNREAGRLVVRDLVAGYGVVEVLRGVDLDVDAGELVALVGANGAGKTTLLRSISALIGVRAGRVDFGPQRLNGLGPSSIVRLGVAHVPERRQIFSEQTVRDNLVLGAYTAGLTAAALNARTEEACAPFPVLLERLSEPAGNLSGGQQQMLAIARALMLRPRLLLLDEPSLGLAPVLVDEIFRFLTTLRGTGTAILLVEQNARQSLAIADRAYVLERGRIVLTGSGPELLRSPRVADLYLGGGTVAHAEARSGRVRDLSQRLGNAFGIPTPNRLPEALH